MLLQEQANEKTALYKPADISKIEYLGTKASCNEQKFRAVTSADAGIDFCCIVSMNWQKKHVKWWLNF